MTKLLVKNAKILKSNDDTNLIYNFGITAYKSRTTGKFTCPAAGTCGKTAGCYAMQKTYTWPVVQQAYEWRYLQTERDDFAALMSKEIAPKLKTAKRTGKQLVIRIHDSGDFYDLNYVRKWFQIIQSFPDVKFYAYTKQVKLFNGLGNNIPNNMTIIYSFGGIFDHLIKETDRHSRVFESVEALELAGYANAMENDLIAIGDNHLVGLVYHGAKNKAWAA